MMDKSMGKLLPFERTGEELRSFADRRIIHGDPLKALELLRLSIAKAPEDPKTILGIAEVYASMRCWALSDEAYVGLLHHEGYEDRAFFGLGENYMAQHLYNAAQDCYAMALKQAPNSPAAPDILDRLNLLDEARQAPMPDDERIQRRMNRAILAMDNGNARLAGRQLRRVMPMGRRNSGLHSMRSFVLLAGGEAAEALEAARRAYRLDPLDIRAVCAVSSALNAVGSSRASFLFLKRAVGMLSETAEMELVYQTACEIGAHEQVAKMLLEAERAEPANDTLLHVLAVALHNSGRTDEAILRWRMLRRIDPRDTVAEYRIHLAETNGLPSRLSYARQVPLEETIARLERLRQWVRASESLDAVTLKEDDALEALLGWGLSANEAGVPSAMCSILAKVGGKRAEAMLEAVLMNPTYPESTKQSALTALYRMDSRGPHYAIMEDRLALVHVSRAKPKNPIKERIRLEGLARRWVAKASGRRLDGALLRGLCEAAVRVEIPISEALRMRAVVVAYCRAQNMMTPFSSTYAGRRKAERMARRILRELSCAIH